MSEQKEEIKINESNVIHSSKDINDQFDDDVLKNLGMGDIKNIDDFDYISQKVIAPRNSLVMEMARKSSFDVPVFGKGKPLCIKFKACSQSELDTLSELSANITDLKLKIAMPYADYKKYGMQIPKNYLEMGTELNKKENELRSKQLLYFTDATTDTVKNCNVFYLNLVLQAFESKNKLSLGNFQSIGNTSGNRAVS